MAVSLQRVEDLLYRRGGKPTQAAPVSEASVEGKGPATTARPANPRPATASPRLPTTDPRFPATASRPRTSDLRLPTTASRQPIALVVSSEQALAVKYGPAGFRQILARLEQLVEAIGQGASYQARLMLVDSPPALKRHGYGQLAPVSARHPAQVRGLINTALPPLPDARPDMVFIIGGPEIIPYWRLPNPSFDSDREVLSDNPYGAWDDNYLLPERIVGRLPDESGRAARLEFLLARLDQALERQRNPALAHGGGPSHWPLRLVGAMLPAGLRQGLDGLTATSFESALTGPLLNSTQARQLAPFFYSAAAWQASTETIRRCLNPAAELLCSPPGQLESFDPAPLRRARLLHFNLHGFRDSPNWYGQGRTGLIGQASPVLPTAFSPALAGGQLRPDGVVFSEACYGGYLPGKAAADSIALTVLDGGGAAFVGSTAVSYGSSGPELACASHLAYHFWQEVLGQGHSFGQALQSARLNYTRERLAVGHDLTGDEAKTLLEFSLLGDPTIGMRSLDPSFVAHPTPGSRSPTSDPRFPPQPKGEWNLSGLSSNLEAVDWQEVRGLVWRVWERVGRSRSRYRAVPSQKLPTDVVAKVEKALAWLLPDPLPASDGSTPARPAWVAMLDMAANWQGPSGRYHKKGEPDFHPARLVVAGQRPLDTADGQQYQQTFLLNTDVQAEQITVLLSKGQGGGR